MFAIIKRLFAVILAWRQPSIPPVKKRTRGPSRGKEVEEIGRFYFKRDILDHLKEYSAIVRKLKARDTDAYSMYRKLGATVIPRTTRAEYYIPPRWKTRKLRPGFGSVVWTGRPDEADTGDIVNTKFAYFRRLDRPPSEIQSFAGDVYEVLLFYPDLTNPKKTGGFLAPIYVGLDEQCRLTPLRFQWTRKQTIIHKDGRSRKGKHTTLKHQEWSYGALEDLAHIDWVSMTIEERTLTAFSMVVSGHELGSSGLRIAATKNGITAAFSIDLLRTPYFFSEREPVYADEGHKKRIFHIVRPHKRVLASGVERYVKSHFRGLRHFTWGGYKVQISMPGTHHADLLDFNGGVHMFDEDEQMPKDFASQEEMTDMIAGHLAGKSMATTFQ